MTHLDFDQAGGLEDFPEATVRVMQSEKDAARVSARFCYQWTLPSKQWNEVKNWKYYAPRGESWFGFEAVRDLEGLRQKFFWFH